MCLIPGGYQDSYTFYIKMNTQRSCLLFVQHFEQFIKVSSSGRRLTASGRRITGGTISGYTYVLRLLAEYEEDQKCRLRIQLLHRTSLKILKREKSYWSRFFISFSSFLFKKKGYYDHYVASVIKIIKTFFNYLSKEKGYVIGNYHISFRVPVQHSTPIVLSPAQLQFLISNKEFENSLNKYQKRAKDIFVFGCTVGLRVSDLMGLKKSNIITSGDNTFLSVYTKKTGTEVRIPLPGYAIEIIHRNRYRSSRHLLPQVSVTNLNIQFKKIVLLAGWDHSIPKMLSYRGRMIEVRTADGHTWPFYQHITAHTMRRTAITTLLTMGVPENIVRKISGHAPGSREFYKYVGLAQEYLNQEVLKAFKKLSELPEINPLKVIG